LCDRERWFLAALLAPKVPKLFDIHDRDAGKRGVEIDGSRRFGRLPFHGRLCIGSGPDWSRLIADDPIERPQLFVTPFKSFRLCEPCIRSRNRVGRTEKFADRFRGSSPSPTKCLDAKGE
jgi:hypothetical protein